MKITARQLRQIITEELSRLNERVYVPDVRYFKCNKCGTSTRFFAETEDTLFQWEDRDPGVWRPVRGGKGNINNVLSREDALRIWRISEEDISAGAIDPKNLRREGLAKLPNNLERLMKRDAAEEDEAREWRGSTQTWGQGRPQVHPDVTARKEIVREMKKVMQLYRTIDADEKKKVCDSLGPKGQKSGAELKEMGTDLAHTLNEILKETDDAGHRRTLTSLFAAFLRLKGTHWLSWLGDGEWTEMLGGRAPIPYQVLRIGLYEDMGLDPRPSFPDSHGDVLFDYMCGLVG